MIRMTCSLSSRNSVRLVTERIGRRDGTDVVAEREWIGAAVLALADQLTLAVVRQENLRAVGIGDRGQCVLAPGAYRW